MKKFYITMSIASLLLSAGSGVAATYTIDDDWVDWEGYSSGLGDENGTPKILEMEVVVTDGYLQSIGIILHGSTSVQAYDSLFINTNWDENVADSWDDWDFFVHGGGSENSANTSGNVVTVDGFYSVDDPMNYDYTLVINANRIGNPNGIDNDSLTLEDASFVGSHVDYEISYDFSDMNGNTGLEVTDGFFVAYAPWCANDVIGGGRSIAGGGDDVPEPATMFLFGVGLTGLMYTRLRKNKKQA